MLEILSPMMGEIRTGGLYGLVDIQIHENPGLDKDDDRCLRDLPIGV